MQLLDIFLKGTVITIVFFKTLFSCLLHTIGIQEFRESVQTPKNSQDVHFYWPQVLLTFAFGYILREVFVSTFC